MRKSEGESSLFKSEGARENQEAAAAELAKEKKKIRGKNLKVRCQRRSPLCAITPETGGSLRPPR